MLFNIRYDALKPPVYNFVSWLGVSAVKNSCISIIDYASYLWGTLQSRHFNQGLSKCLLNTYCLQQLQYVGKISYDINGEI